MVDLPLPNPSSLKNRSANTIMGTLKPAQKQKRAMVLWCVTFFAAIRDAGGGGRSPSGRKIQVSAIFANGKAQHIKGFS